MHINITNGSAIEHALKSVNGRSTAHAYTYADEIAALALAADSELDSLRLLKSERPGARYVAQSGPGLLPGSYRGTLITTTVTLERGTRAWYLVDVQRSERYPRSRSHRAIHLTPEQSRQAVAALQRSYVVVDDDRINTTAPINGAAHQCEGHHANQ